jgi:3-methyladenine DNA glycosylase Mpg
MRLSIDYFKGNPNCVAERILGRYLVRNWEGKLLVGQIMTVRAFSGMGRGIKKPERMKRDHGRIYIMPYRGKDFMNITTGTPEEPSCIWIYRVLYDNAILGPGKFTREFHIDESLDGKRIDGDELYIDEIHPGKIKFRKIDEYISEFGYEPYSTI